MIQIVNVFLAGICLLPLLFPQHVTFRVFLIGSLSLWLLGMALAQVNTAVFPLAVLIFFTSQYYRLLPKQRPISGLVLISSLLILNENPAFVFHTWLSIDKPFALLALTYALGDTRLGDVRPRYLTGLLLLGLPLFILLAWWALDLTYAPSWQSDTAAKLAHNLLFTCIPEELLFRAWLQRSLGNKLNHHWYALLIMSLLFGVAHIRFGITFALLAATAGLLYGAAYLLGGRLYWAVLTHFAVNASHAVLFTASSG